MSAIDNGGPAFPSGLETGHMAPLHNGMTLRDYFAAKAMAGLLSAPDVGVRYKDSEGTPEWIEQQVARDVAGVAYLYADAMLAAREKGGAA